MRVKINGEYQEYSKNAYNKEVSDNFPAPEKPSIFFKYPHDETVFTTPFVKFYTVPEGWSVVNKVGARITEGRPVRGSGWRFMIGLGGLLQSAHVINTTLRTQDLEARDAVTKDGVQLPQIDATLNYIVKDPRKALSVTDYRQTVFERASGRVIGFVGDNTLEELLEGDFQDKNLVTGENGKKIIFPDVKNVGAEITNLYVTNISLPQELRDELSMAAQKRAEAEGIKVTADAKLYEAGKIAQGAELLSKIPEAMRLRTLEMYEAFANGPNNTTTLFPFPRDINVNVGSKEREADMVI